MADTVNQFKNGLDKHWANYAFLYDYLVNYNGTGSLFVVYKNCENLDVDLEATACVHSLQYSTVQYSMCRCRCVSPATRRCENITLNFVVLLNHKRPNTENARSFKVTLKQ